MRIPAGFSAPGREVWNLSAKIGYYAYIYIGVVDSDQDNSGTKKGRLGLKRSDHAGDYRAHARL